MRNLPVKIGVRRAFSLVELLIVVMIITILVAILLPVVTKVRAHAKATVCQNNVRQLMAGFLAFAADHDGLYPGSKNNNPPSDPNPDHHDWLAAGAPQGAPQAGTIWKYVKNADVYKCPAIEFDAFAAKGGSNDHFDYAAFCMFAGAPLRLMPATATLRYPDGHTATFPTPVIVQEDAVSINGANIEGGHSESDQISHIHFGGSYYAAPDGSVNFVVEPPTGNCHSWSAIGPTSHAPVDMGPDEPYGAWSSK